MIRFLLGAAIVGSCSSLFLPLSLEAQSSQGTAETWTVETVAGGGPLGNQLLAGVEMGEVSGLAWDPDGNLVYTNSVANVIRRIHLDTGTEETIAGTGIAGFSGDGGPATSARLHLPVQVRFDAEGNLYFVDALNYRVRKITRDGTISTVLGNGLQPSDGMDWEGDARDVAVMVALTYPFDVDAAGNLYFARPETGVVRKAAVGQGGDGQVRIIGGIPDGCSCSDGDGGKATAAHFGWLLQLAVGPDGSVYVVERGNLQSKIRRISPDGIVNGYAGYGGPLPCISNGGCATASLASGPALNGFVGQLANLWSDSSGGLYFREVGTFTPDGIQHITPGGDLAPVGVAQVLALAVSKDGRMAVIREFSARGALAEVTVDQDGTLQIGNIAEPARGYSPDGTLATDAFLTNPMARLTSNGEMYLLDDCNIRLVGSDGRLKTLRMDDQCLNPPDSAVDSKGRLWFRKAGSDFIIDQQGNLQPLQHANLGGAPNIELDGKDRLYVLGSTYLNRLESNGSVRAIVWPTGSTQSYQLEAMGVGADGKVYFIVTSFANPGRYLYRVNDDGSYDLIQRGIADGVFQLLAEGEFLVDRQGMVWAGNGFFDARGAYYSLGREVAREVPGGTPELVQETGFVQGGGLDIPQVVGLGSDGTLYIEDGKRIRHIRNMQSLPTPVIETGGIVSAASFAAGPVAPGELISIFGSGFAPDAVPLRSAELTNNAFPEALGHVKVWINGIAGRITAVTPKQINVFVPSYDPIPSGPVDVVVQVDDRVSAPMTVQIAPASPGLFSSGASGTGQGAILNQDLSVNGASNPAAHGSVIALYGTGMGATSPEIPPGTLSIPLPYPTTDLPVHVTIGGMDAEVTYAGAAPELASGVFQINARIPAGAGSGDLLVQVKIGDQATNQSVTVYVQ